MRALVTVWWLRLPWRLFVRTGPSELARLDWCMARWGPTT